MLHASGQMVRKGFTLTELLVVIVIIAVLSALLFPVFQSAREAAKKSVTSSNFKQVASAMILYTNDNDDTYPLAWSPDTTNGVWRSLSGSGGVASYLISIPAGWRGGTYGAEPRKSEDSQFWANSISNYAKGWGIYSAEGVPHFRSGANTMVDDYANHPNYGSSSVTFNGLLHAYPASSVASPSQHPMLWQGMFKRSYDGFARTNPELDCFDLATPCRFVPNDYAQTGTWTPINPGYGYIWYGAINPYGTAWIYGRGMHFVRDDGSAKFQFIQAPSMSANDTGGITRLGSVMTTSPFTRLSSDPQDQPGTPFYSADCDAKLDGIAPSDDGVTKNIAYDCFFRPDSQYGYDRNSASDY